MFTCPYYFSGSNNQIVVERDVDTFQWHLLCKCLDCLYVKVNEDF